jgi:hypothetical protein
MTLSKSGHAIFGKAKTHDNEVVQIFLVRQANIKEAMRRGGNTVEDEVAKALVAQLYLRLVKKMTDEEEINRLAIPIMQKSSVRYYQRASEVMKDMEPDPEWEVPVALVTWPIENKSTASSRTVTCSRCGRELEPLGSIMDDLQKGNRSAAMVDEDASYLTAKQWKGTVCSNCSMVFCEQCQDSTWASPCRNCGQPVAPATAYRLPQQQRKLSMDNPPFSKESLQETQQLKPKKKWWQFWK